MTVAPMIVSDLVVMTFKTLMSEILELLVSPLPKFQNVVIMI